MTKLDATKHYVKCDMCRKMNEAGMCVLRFWDHKTTLILPKLCPYGLRAKWSEFHPTLHPKNLTTRFKPMVRNQDERKEIAESWAVRN